MTGIGKLSLVARSFDRRFKLRQHPTKPARADKDRVRHFGRRLEHWRRPTLPLPPRTAPQGASPAERRPNDAIEGSAKRSRSFRPTSRRRSKLVVGETGVGVVAPMIAGRAPAGARAPGGAVAPDAAIVPNACDIGDCGPRARRRNRQRLSA
jgi:hypothetical protein